MKTLTATLQNRFDKLLVKIPNECPLARTVVIFGKSYLVKPCKLNPFYEQIMMAKFKAMERLAAQ